MGKSIISEEKIQKFDDVHIKSMNLSGVVYAIKGKDVVVNTLKKGLVKAKMDDLKKLYTDSVNEVGKGDWHFKEIKKLWDKASSFTRKKIAALITKNPNSSWDKIEQALFGSDYDDVTYYTDRLHLESVNEGHFGEIDIIAQNASNFKEFVKEFFSEYKDFPKTKESLKWLEDIYKGRTKMEGLERVATALPQTEEEPVNEEEKSPEEILQGLKQMAMGDLERIEDYAEMIADRMKQGQELSSWMYSQITLAVDQLNSVHDSMDGKDGIKEAELPKAMIPGPIKAKLTMAIDKIKDTNLSYPQKLQVIGKIIDSLGIDKKELAKISSRLKGTLESVNEENEPTNPELWDKAIAAAKRKYDVYPSAYANAFASKWYKEKGGDWKTKKESIKEHKDCGCGCGGVTEGGCGTSLTEKQLNEWRAEEVLQQLGGRKFIAMTGAKNFVKNDKEKSITFKLPKAKSGINYIRITLTSMDVYNVDFISVRGTNIKTVATEKGVYNDQLQSIFTKHTGLYTSL